MRVAEVLRVVDVVAVQRRLHAVGQVVCREGRQRHLLDRQAGLGRALDGELPAAELDVVLVGLEQVGGDALGLLDDLAGGLVDGDATHHQRPRAVGVHPLRARPGVAGDELDVVERHAEGVRDDLAPRGVVALTVRGRTGHDLDLAGREHAHRGRLPATGAVGQRAQDAGRRQTAHLGEGRDADAELHDVLAVAAALLLRTQPDHVEHLLGLLGGRLVVARVVGQPRHHGVRELLVRDPVLLAQLHRVAPEGVRQLIHDPLDGVRRLRTAGAAVGVRRGLGGEDAGAGEVVARHLVDGREHEGPEHRHAGRDQLQVGAHVGEQLDLQSQQRAVLPRRDLDVLDLVAAVRGGLVVLAARLGPLDRAAELAGDHQRQHLLGVDVELGTEAAAHVRRDDADLVLRDAGHQGQHHAQDVRDLRGRVERELVRGRDGRDDDAAVLHRGRDQALLLEAAAHHDRVVAGVGDGLGVVGSGAREVEQEALVGALVAVDQRRTLLEGLLHVDHGGQLVVLHRDRLEGVGRGVAAARDDDGDAVTDVAHLVGGERRVGRRDHVGGDRPGARHRRAHDVGKVLAAVGGNDARHLERGGDVDRDDLGVGHRAAQHGHVQQAGQGDVVGPVGLAGDELGVLLAATAPPQLPAGVRLGEGVGVREDLGGHQARVQLLGHEDAPVVAGSSASRKEPAMGPSPRMSEAADMTAFTMFW